mgnify:FL=1
MNYFPFKRLPTELQEMIIRKMDMLSWMNYQLAIGKSISVKNVVWDKEELISEDMSDTSSCIYSDESYDMDKEFLSCSDTEYD